MRDAPAVPPATGAIVMGTGIVATDLDLAGAEALSRVLLGLAIAVWVLLAALTLRRALSDRRGLAMDARTPAALTAVAGTAVIGSELVVRGVDWGGVGALVLAVALWLGLIRGVLGELATRAVGVSFMVVVALAALAELGGAIALSEHARWLLAASLVPFALALLLYWLLARRFDMSQVGQGLGDQWVAGGALAISTLAAATLAISARGLGLAGAHDVLEPIAIAIWIGALLWLPVLLAAELLCPRLRYSLARWSTVFPVGMYAAAGFGIAAAAREPWIASLARAWTWVALAVWGVVAAGTLRSLR